ncbi:hypothetical protein BZA70DRAFT_279385 [Myxozyma melibiosi]|uniref:Rho-GAP domain-containing protein n=1 Tax=Myxozyma melibiosi TaxID=54550 RepID=A0ABR1F5Z4_9ASCO
MNDSGPSTPADVASAPSGAASSTSATITSDPQAAYEKERVQTLLQSDVGVELLLKRLKLSIGSGKEFSTFLKKRAAAEDDSATALKRLVRTTQEAIRKPDGRQDSFSARLEETLRIHEQLAEHSSKFAAFVGQMHDHLADLCKETERSRKMLKEKGLRDEKNVIDAEQTAIKSQTKYNTLAEEFDRVRTGDPTKRSMKFKSNKNGPQYEEELHRKVMAAESEYKQKVQTAQSMLRDLLNVQRPDTVRQLRSTLETFDSGLTLQFQRYTNLCEALFLSKGLAVSPMKADEFGARSISDMSSEVDNDTDFLKYVLHEGSGKVLRRKEVEFKQHKAVGGSSSSTSRPKTTTVAGATVAGTVSQPSSRNVSGATAPKQITSASAAASAAAAAPSSSPAPAQQKFIPSTASVPSSSASNGSSAPGPYKTSSMLLADNPPQQPKAAPVAAVSPYVPIPIPPVPNGNKSASSPVIGSTNNVSNNGEPSKAVPPEVSSPYMESTPSVPTPQYGRVFGVPLEVLMEEERVQLNVENVIAPAMVLKLIEAVDKYGLDKEGIYNLQGSSQEIEHIQSLFESTNPLYVELGDLSMIHNDVYAVGTTLKLYFKALPDSLFTDVAYDKFVEASKITDDNLRRDSMHYLVNDLPDSNYTTLRYLILHLSRVQDNFRVNKMTIRNLAKEWGTILMSGDPRDAESHAIVVSTILTNCYLIFAS